MRVGARRATLATVALLLTGCGGGSASGAGPTVQVGQPAKGTTTVDSTSFRCPDPVHTVATTGSGSLPTSATAALICYRSNHELWFAPAGALTHGVRRIVRLVDAQAVQTGGPHQACNADLGPAYAIVLQYADGARVITGEADGCQPVTVGPTVREGARRVLNVFLAALSRQRRHGSAPDTHPSPPTCPTSRIPPFSPLADPTRMAAASLCTHLDDRWNGVRPGRPSTPRQLAALRHDLATARARVFEPSPGQHLCRSPVLRGPLRVSALDAWGDQFVVDLACDTYRYVPRGGHGPLTVHLLPATARVLARG